jgi:hypothetical protein
MKMEDTEGADGPMEYTDETEGDGYAARRVEDGEATHLAVETSEGVAGAEAMNAKVVVNEDGQAAEQGGQAAVEGRQAAEEGRQAAEEPWAGHSAPDTGAENGGDTVDLVPQGDTASAEAETRGEDRRTPSPFHAVETAEAASAPSPISPYIIQSEEVNPPPGLLATGIHISPASSQPMSSPTPNRDARLLRVQSNPSNRSSGPTTRSRSRSPNLPQSGDILAGPMTRSRSQSRSPHPPAPSNRSEKPIRQRQR